MRAVHIPEFQAVFIFVVNIGVHIAKNANKTEKESGIRPIGDNCRLPAAASGETPQKIAHLLGERLVTAQSRGWFLGHACLGAAV